jgi:hypothetical protein
MGPGLLSYGHGHGIICDFFDLILAQKSENGGHNNKCCYGGHDAPSKSPKLRITVFLGR